MKIIDTRRTVTGLLGGIATLALAHFIGPLPAVVLVIAVYYLYKPIDPKPPKLKKRTRQLAGSGR